MITHDLVIKMLDFVKDTSCGTFEYGKWGSLNIEQRKLIRELCKSWLILDEATNKQTLEIERLNNIINELEKDFERKIQSCTIEAETTTNDFYCRLHIATLKKWLNKIQELKGSDKE